MSDLISRADAIDAVQTYLDILINSRRHGDDFTFINVLTDIRNNISALPSAEAVTNGRIIDADALSEKLCETTIFIKDGEVFQRMINDAPTVSAEAEGEWIDIDNYYRMATCSHCRKVTMFEKWGECTKPYNFCPNCGARMYREDGEA